MQTLAPSARLASVSVDLDSLHHYCRIHGVDERVLTPDARALVYRLAVPRLMELTDALALPVTLFAVGEDLENAWAQTALTAALKSGRVEVGNHSYRHLYRLTRLGAADIAREIAEGGEAIRHATGTAPVGFRAPGYAVTGPVFEALEQQGYRYDSSVFPAAPYYVAKAAVMGTLAALGRPSHALLDRPGVLLAPRAPYRPARENPYRRGNSSVLELPITVMPFTRVPFIGTLVVALPAAAVVPLYKSLARVSHFNFELHAVDVLDGSDGIPEALTRQQRDLRIPARLKLQRLRAILRRLGDEFSPCTLADAATRLRSNT